MRIRLLTPLVGPLQRAARAAKNRQAGQAVQQVLSDATNEYFVGMGELEMGMDISTLRLPAATAS